MLKKLTATAILSALSVAEAAAHQDGGAHSHPHLIISNELLAGFLLAAAAVIVLAARKTMTNRSSLKISKRGNR